MADRGLQEAIRAVGGVTELARRIGISQPSVSNWTRVPAERVLQVENASGVARGILRPDLYAEADVDDVARGRAQQYALLARLLRGPPDAALLKQIGQLQSDETALGNAHRELADAGARATAAEVEREFFALFIGVGRGELLPYASYYITGFLHERPLARLRQDLSRFGIARAHGVAEPEDHAGILCEIMAGLASGQLPAPELADRTIFERHVAPWMGRFFADLERAETAEFYKPVGTMGRIFIEIEAEAFALPHVSAPPRRTGDETGQQSQN
jgi:TorA maturation chaperone TorD